MNLIQSILSRRNMLAGLAGSAALVGAASAADARRRPAKPAKSVKEPLWASRPKRPNGPLATASVDEWAQHVGTKFQTSTGHTLRLVDVKEFADQNKRPAELRDRAFAARFDVVAGTAPLPDQLTLRVNHKVGGTFDLFLTAGNPETPLSRVAVFS